MAVVCEEIFDETSHPSASEIRDYASKIGIDPDSEPQLLPLAAEGLMKALPAGWKPCYDDTSKTYYYYNNHTGKTQWEHPLDDIYRGLVKKTRAESQSLSLGEPTEDATYDRDEIPSYEEPHPPAPPKLAHRRLSPLLPLSGAAAATPPSAIIPKSGTAPLLKPLNKQKSEELLLNRKITLNVFSTSFDEGVDGGRGGHHGAPGFDRHPRGLEKGELKVSGGGSMFLKCNTGKSKQQNQENAGTTAQQLLDAQPRSILRNERNSLEVSRSLEFDKISLEDDDKKSVRFNLDNTCTTDMGFTFSDKSSSSNSSASEAENNVVPLSPSPGENKIIDVKISPNNNNINAINNANKTKSRFTITKTSDDLDANNCNLKLIKPNPTDFITPKLTVSKDSDSDDEYNNYRNNSDNEADEDNYQSIGTKRLETRADKKIAQMKQTIWNEKNDELVKFRENLEQSHKEELERVLTSAKSDHELLIKSALDKLAIEMDSRRVGALSDEQSRLELQSQELEAKMKKSFEEKQEELERYYEEKLADIEKELAEQMEKRRDEIVNTHASNIEQLKQNHTIIIENLKKEFKAEEDIIRRDHRAVVAEVRQKIAHEVESGKGDEQTKKKSDEKHYEKIRCEKRLLEDKYRCLKDKYLRLKTEVKLSMEKRNKRKENSGTTGSETERSNSNTKERTPLDSPLRKPPATPKPKDPQLPKPHRLVQDLADTSISDKSEDKTNTTNKNDYDDSSVSSTNPGRSRKKIFSRLKSSSTSRITLNNNNNNNNGNNNNNCVSIKSRRSQRSCSPVENLRRQLQKLEDLEDQFPPDPPLQQDDTPYHLRYPFCSEDGQHQQKFDEGSSELEFFRHRIHLERDSIKRAKESLRSQKTMFQQRQKELKLKHGSMARHTLQQLCQEEKELTDMEVSLHRTRSLLGEKVIRLRHLEQSLQRANATATTAPENRGLDEATLSDISSHSASSGISSTIEFGAAAPDGLTGRLNHLMQHQESSEIIQSLENLNSEIQEIWDVLRKQHQAGGIAAVMPPLVYPDFGWPLLAAAAAGGAAVPAAPPSIPTLADRLHNYRQHVALANAQSTVVTQHAASQGGATTTLVERTRNLRHWLKQAGIDGNVEGSTPQTTL